MPVLAASLSVSSCELCSADLGVYVLLLSYIPSDSYILSAHFFTGLPKLFEEELDRDIPLLHFIQQYSAVGLCISYDLLPEDASLMMIEQITDVCL